MKEDPTLARALAERAHTFAEVLAEEIKEIAESRRVRRPSVNPSGDAKNVLQRAHDAQLIGLALSGGGIRSAIFNLGVLQALSRYGWLHLIDYTSTVSGGGYVGSWIAAWIRRAGLKTVEDELRCGRRAFPGSLETPALHFLREYGNYLTPRLGIFGADTWTIVATYLRNLVLNLLVLLLIIAAVLLLPGLSKAAYAFAGVNLHLTLVALVVIPMGVAITSFSLNVSDLFERPAEGDRKTKFYALPFWTWLLALIPILIAAWGCSAALSASYAPGRQPPSEPGWIWVIALSLLYTALWMAALLIRYACIVTIAKEKDLWHTIRQRFRSIGSLLIGALVAGGVAGAVLHLFAHALTTNTWFSVYGYAFGPVVMLITFSFILVIHIGIAGHGFSEEAHEWFSRIMASKTLFALLWCGLFGTFLLGDKLPDRFSQWGPWAGLTLVAWVLAILLRVGTSRSSQGGTPPPNFFRRTLGRLGPPLFVLILLVSLAAVLERIEKYFENYFFGTQTALVSGLLFVALLAAALLLSWRVGINRFSLHTPYRNRLVRCFLGASNIARQGHPFIDFDPRDDDVQLADLRTNDGRPYIGPYPIINTAMNLVASDNRAWQKRKAASFALTPMFCGFDVELGHRSPAPSSVGGSIQRSNEKLAGKGYRPTRSGHESGYGGQLSLGTAMTISGAAASPNMGYYSSPAITCLMTVFNLRLGWWLGNPRAEATWRRGGPRLGLFHLFRELFGKTDDTSNYIYLSDGGHFENLGVYELVKRRCRFIIVSDGTEDRNFKFGDLGNAIEKCRTDFGIEIEIDIEPIRKRNEQNHSSWHCAVGAIRYDRIDPAVPAGTLVYLKSSVTGDEPTDVRRYAGQNSQFPHESTSKQWFDESQFESYRALGYHIVDSVLGAVTDDKDAEPEPEKIFLRLRERWYPASSAIQESFTRHTATFDAICTQIRTDKRLRFLDAQIYPEWQKIVKDTTDPSPDQLWLPSDDDQLHAGFHFCNQLIQLMENVYLDLKFDEECNHPDNRGWMNLFRHWAWSGMFRVTWAVNASIYGSRFQRFCETRLHLDIGEVQIRKLIGQLPDGVYVDCNLSDLLAGAQPAGVLNFREVKLIRNFLRKYGEFDTPATAIYLLQIGIRDVTREEEVDPCICFTFGFALIADEKIIYFRVQDHLRKMGLARRALVRLIAHRPEIQLDLKSAPPNVADKVEIERFNNLFQSVAYEHRPLARARVTLVNQLYSRGGDLWAEGQRPVIKPSDNEVNDQANHDNTSSIKLRS